MGDRRGSQKKGKFKYEGTTADTDGEVQVVQVDDQFIDSNNRETVESMKRLKQSRID
jgi:hypothetical protein